MHRQVIFTETPTGTFTYIDADIRLWTPLTTSNTNSGGGWPRYPKNMDYGYKQGDINTINTAIDGTRLTPLP
ncbi:hypothetical protein AB6G07_10180 [Providencia stuartii]|uniref:hypothetical protein n=1 Tax=Providencia stuartii TaxID=588 RepID=UPI0034DD5DE3